MMTSELSSEELLAKLIERLHDELGMDTAWWYHYANCTKCSLDTGYEFSIFDCQAPVVPSSHTPVDSLLADIYRDRIVKEMKDYWPVPPVTYIKLITEKDKEAGEAVFRRYDSPPSGESNEGI